MEMHKPTTSSNQSKHPHSIKPVGDCISDVLMDTQRNILRQMLLRKSNEELVDALFEIVYLSDLLDFFKDDIDHFLAAY